MNPYGPLVNNYFLFFEIWRKITHYFTKYKSEKPINSSLLYFINNQKFSSDSSTYPQLHGVAQATHSTAISNRQTQRYKCLFIILKFDDKDRENIAHFYVS